SSNDGAPPTDPSASCYWDDPENPGGDYICFGQQQVFGPSPSGQPPFNAFSIVRDLRTPRAHNYNLSIQQEIARNNVLTVGYSGQKGQNLIAYRDLNASPIGTIDTPTGLVCGSGEVNEAGDSAGSCDPYRPFAGAFPDLQHIIQMTNLGYSQYD